MGFEEYNLIKTTMLEVAEKNNSIEAIKSDIDEIESRKGKINAKIAKLRKDIEELNSEFNFDNEKVERLESGLKSSEDALSHSENNLAIAGGFSVLWLLLFTAAMGLESRDEKWGETALFCLIPLLGILIFAFPTLNEEEEKSHKGKITDRKNLLEGFYSLPQEIEKLEKSISKENEEIKESDSDIEDLEKDIEKINSEISDMMDSIKHLIPYADKI